MKQQIINSLLVIAAMIIGGLIVFFWTRPQPLSDDEYGYLIQEYCEQQFARATISGSTNAATYTHKLRRYQIVVVRCIHAEEVQP